MELKTLNKIGLTEGEIKVYQALLETGECTKTSLAQKSGVAPSNIYDITNRLIEKGIISKVEINGIAHFSPANPKHILSFLEKKKQDIQKEEDVVNSMLPFLLSKFSNNQSPTKVEVFQGWPGLKTVFEDLIDECKKGDENFVFGASKGKDEKQADNFFIKYSKLRAEKGIVTNIIFNQEIKENRERINFFKKTKNINLRFLQQSTPTEIMVYKNKACIIILNEVPLVIRITSQEASDSFKQYFQAMWKIAKP